ncbi:hypothetical protein ACU61A_41205 [Pseudonocardia sichuanensis]
MSDTEMTDTENLPRTLHVTIAGAREVGREVRVTPARMDSLADGDLFVGPDYFTASGPTAYEVTTSCAKHEREWLEVRDLTMTDAQVGAGLAEPGGVEPGCDPRDGVFCYSPDAQLLRVDDGQPLQ